MRHDDDMLCVIDKQLKKVPGLVIPSLGINSRTIFVTIFPTEANQVLGGEVNGDVRIFMDFCVFYVTRRGMYALTL